MKFKFNQILYIVPGNLNIDCIKSLNTHIVFKVLNLKVDLSLSSNASKYMTNNLVNGTGSTLHSLICKMDSTRPIQLPGPDKDQKLLECISVVKHLLSMSEGLSLILALKKKKERKRKNLFYVTMQAEALRRNT
jgi:hypothetical protein